MNIEITMEEILEDLCWPGPPPGQLAVGAARPARADQFPARRTAERGWSELEPIAA